MQGSTTAPLAPSAPSWPDRLGVWASAACVLHCLLFPVLLSLSAVFAHLLPSEEHTHRLLASVVALCGAAALPHGYRRHRRPAVLWLMAGGLACIVGAAIWGDRLRVHGAEMALTLAGSLLMIAAHRRNHTFCRQCACTRS